MIAKVLTHKHFSLVSYHKTDVVEFYTDMFELGFYMGFILTDGPIEFNLSIFLKLIK